jgi:hypothetical protein
MGRLARFAMALLGLAVLSVGFAQPNYAGTFTTQGQNGPITLTLQQDAKNITGTLSAGATTFRLAGQLQEDGTILGLADTGSGRVYFAAQVRANELELVLAEVDPQTNGVLAGSERSILFTRSGGASLAPQNAQKAVTTTGQAGAFAGTFQNSDITLTLQAAEGGYQGTLNAGNSRYQVQAQGSGNALNGTLVVGSTTYLFAAQLNGNSLSLQVNGQTYQLTRSGGVGLPGLPSVGGSQASPVASTATATAGFPSNSVEAQPNQIYQAGTYVKSSPFGVAAKIPVGFQGAVSSLGLWLGKGNELNLMMVPAVGAGVGDLVALLSQPFPLTEGITLLPAGRPEVKGDTVSVRLTAGQYTAIAYGLASRDVGVFFLSIGAAGSENAQATALKEFADSTRFASPTYASILKQYKTALSGKRLYRFAFSSSGTAGGSSFSTTSNAQWDLCSDGSYFYEGSSESSNSLKGFPGYDGSAIVTPPQQWASVFGQYRSGSAGWWRLVIVGDQLTLVLVGGNGSITSHTLQPDGQYVRMDGGKDQLTVNASAKCQ